MAWGPHVSGAVTMTVRASFPELRLQQFLHPSILDRYLVRELGGPSIFGLSAFTLIFVATQMLAIGRLASEEHASLLALIEYFLWDMPQFLLYVIPMAMLLGTLLAMQRLSGDSEIAAMKAGGISLARIMIPLATVGLIVSIASLTIQEILVPIANDRAAYIREAVIKHLSLAAGTLTATTQLPGGGKQVTIAGSLDAATEALLNVTVLRYDRDQRLVEMIVSDRATFDKPTWAFENATTYQFSGGDVTGTLVSPRLQVDIGESPNQVAKRTATITDPENLSRAEIREALAGGGLSELQRRSFTATYAAKLARPFAALVFVLIAVPLGLRRIRGGGTSAGFSLAVGIVFVYYVIATMFLNVGAAAYWLAGIAAWTPNALFSLIGLWLLRRASAV
jgi:lipopolysaccharide export system permease protein